MTFQSGVRACIALFLFAVLAFSFGAFAATNAWAANDPVPLEDLPSLLAPDEVVKVARELIAASQYDPARRLLEAVRKTASDQADVLFLLGSIAVLEEHFADAAELFREILARRPELTRVRLELARALYLDHDDDAAEHHFQLVLAEQPPGPVADNIRKFIDAIRARRVWRFSGALALAPDTNINVAPEEERINIFGLPFSLDAAAQETSGIGLVVGGGVEYSPSISENTKLTIGMSANHREYEGRDFDDTFVSAALGPEFFWPKNSLKLQVTGFYRWYGHEKYNRSLGFRATYQRDLSEKYRVTGLFDYQYVDYLLNDDLDGSTFTLVGQLDYGLSSRSFLRGFAAISAEDAREKSFRNTEWRVGFGYYRELGWGIIAYIQPDIAFNPFEGMQAAFGKKRTDWVYRLPITLIKRDIEWLGFSPEVAYTFVRNDSNIDLFAYTRHRVEIGVTRKF